MTYQRNTPGSVSLTVADCATFVAVLNTQFGSSVNGFTCQSIVSGAYLTACSLQTVAGAALFSSVYNQATADTIFTALVGQCLLYSQSSDIQTTSSSPLMAGYKCAVSAAYIPSRCMTWSIASPPPSPPHPFPPVPPLKSPPPKKVAVKKPPPKKAAKKPPPAAKKKPPPKAVGR